MYYFWCSYHGKGRCDGHFAVGKCMHRRLVLQGELLMEARDFVEMNNPHLVNTEATLVDGLQTQQGECVLRGVIKKFHKVEFDLQLGDHIRFWETATSSECTVQQLQDICEPEDPCPSPDPAAVPDVPQEMLHAQLLGMKHNHYNSADGFWVDPRCQTFCVNCGQLVPICGYATHFAQCLHQAGLQSAMR